MVPSGFPGDWEILEDPTGGGKLLAMIVLTVAMTDVLPLTINVERIVVRTVVAVVMVLIPLVSDSLGLGLEPEVTGVPSDTVETMRLDAGFEVFPESVGTSDTDDDP